jgi:hypothetical protein
MCDMGYNLRVVTNKNKMGYIEPVSIGMRKKTKENFNRYRPDDKGWDDYITMVTKIIKDYVDGKLAYEKKN